MTDRDELYAWMNAILLLTLSCSLGIWTWGIRGSVLPAFLNTFCAGVFLSKAINIKRELSEYGI